MAGRRGINDRVARAGVRLAGAGVLLEAMDESEFQREHVVDGLRRRGWYVTVIPDMRKVRAGWPDVSAWHHALPGLLLLWELKTETGQPTRTQQRVLAHLRTVPGVDARLVRPRNWSRLRDALDSDDVIAALAAIQGED